MKRLLTTLILISMNSIAFASPMVTPLGTDTIKFKESSMCEKINDNKEQCDLKEENLTLIFNNISVLPTSAHIIYNKETTKIEALMFKDNQYAAILKTLNTKLGTGKSNITNTVTSWNKNGWIYTLSKNPHNEIALIGMPV